MGILRYLAMTAGELQSKPQPDFPVAWMSCHFSPNNSGLSNIPTSLPANSMLILDDCFPFQNHDKNIIADQLTEIFSRFQIKKLLLDFQRPKTEDLINLHAHLCATLPCAIAVTESYAEKNDCTVFLSPPPLHRALKDHIAPWKAREIWLEIAPATACYTVTENGCREEADSPSEENYLHHDEILHVNYQITAWHDRVEFRLRRTQSEIAHLLKEAETLGISTAVGLYQELK